MSAAASPSASASGALRATAFVLQRAGGPVPCVRLESHDGARAIVSLRGAQVLSWIPSGGTEQLYLSALGDIADGGAIRGGIPVIFPQFGTRGPLIKHGFARGLDWHFNGVDDGSEQHAAVFVLHHNDATHAQWPHRFSAHIRVAMAHNRMTVTLHVENRDSEAFEFSCALHTYVRVADIAEVRVDGVAGARYLDNTNDNQEMVETTAPLQFDGELDRVYLGSTCDKTLHDGTRSLMVTMQDFTDTVVWNPGETLAMRIADLAPGDHRHFVCVEPAAIEPMVNLHAGASWRAMMRLEAVVSPQSNT